MKFVPFIFVGGLLDSKRVYLEEGQSIYRLPVLGGGSSNLEQEEPTVEVILDDETYYKVAFKFYSRPPKTHTVFVLDRDISLLTKWVNKNLAVLNGGSMEDEGVQKLEEIVGGIKTSREKLKELAQKHDPKSLGEHYSALQSALFIAHREANILMGLMSEAQDKQHLDTQKQPEID